MNHRMIKPALYRALFITIMYIIAYIFYSNNFIRENIEDVAFDVVSKLSLKTKAFEMDGPKVLLFTIDDIYMQAHNLYDKNNENNYGYLFPRGLLAQFIENLDELIEEAEVNNRPRALFIDYDMSFTTLPYGKVLSIEDKKLLDVLKKDRSYTIFLPKTDCYNFIEMSNDKAIQQAIKNEKIIFVSVSLLQSSDGIVRRYQGYKLFENNDVREDIYDNVAVALWRILKEETSNKDINRAHFYKDDIVANRIITKEYRSYIEEDDCSIAKSYWGSLVKYSANCSLFDIIEEDYEGSILMLGGSHRHNGDNFDVNNVWSTDTFSGVEIHANTLMTILHLNGQLHRLSLFISLVIVFTLFFSLSLVVSWVLKDFAIIFSKKEFFISITLSTVALILISIYLLNEYNLWFNWLAPWVAFGFSEIFLAIGSWIPLNFTKWRKNE